MGKTPQQWTAGLFPAPEGRVWTVATHELTWDGQGALPGCWGPTSHSTPPTPAPRPHAPNHPWGLPAVSPVRGPQAGCARPSAQTFLSAQTEEPPQ